jgi:hypothetical protein
MRYLGRGSNILLHIVMLSGLVVPALTQALPAGRRGPAACTNPSSGNLNPYCRETPLAVVSTDPELKSKFDSLIGQDLYMCASNIYQVAEFAGMLYRALEDGGEAAAPPVPVRAFEPMKIEKIYSAGTPIASGRDFYIVVRMKSNMLGAVRSDAYAEELRSSQDPLFSLLRHVRDRVDSDPANTPFTQAEFDAIERQEIQVGTTENVLRCALAPPLEKHFDARHRAVYLYGDGQRITVDNGYVVAVEQTKKR